MEKAFDSVETPILLERIYSVGVNGKLRRLLKSMYSTATARVRVDSCFSEKVSISRGVKQGSTLHTPTLFLVFMDNLTRVLRESSEGLSVKGLYMGAALHADDLRISTPSMECLTRQDKVINHFTAESSLKLNQEKLEIVKISTTNRREEDRDTMKVGSIEVTPSVNARRLSVPLNPRLTAKDSVRENIQKSRRAFFGMGRLGAFQGDLNPLSSCSIFEPSIVPTLLYGCETWLLDTSCLKQLEAFQHEIGCRIPRVPKFYSAVAVRVALHWPSIFTLIFTEEVELPR